MHTIAYYSHVAITLHNFISTLPYVAKYSQENFRKTLENSKNYKSIAQQIFPHLQYVCTVTLINKGLYSVASMTQYESVLMWDVVQDYNYPCE